MGHGGRPGERLDMVAGKAANDTPVVDEIDWLVAQIECLCSVYFQHYALMLPHYHLGGVVSQTAYLLEPYWLSSADMHSSTSYVNKR